jgi:hypothetical protein
VILLLIFITHFFMFCFGALTYWFLTDERLVSERKYRSSTRDIRKRYRHAAHGRRGPTIKQNSRTGFDPGLHRPTRWSVD